LASVASKVLGQSARATLEALVDGEVEPSKLAQHARGRMKPKKAELEEALEGSVGPHQRFCSDNYWLPSITSTG
jgi:transposase